MAESAKMIDSEMPSNPFPGLRPFEFHESLLYFGRDGQSEQVIRKLGSTRFVAVVGTSGSGKSSLVRAGLLPTLYGGFITSAGSDWRVAIMRPGNNPIGNLADALSATEVLGSSEEDAATQAAIIEATLRRGSLGLVEAVRQARMSRNENLLVIADQFEELFRYARVSESQQYQNDAAAFVKLLLEASRQKEVPIFVVLTMRSDFLGDCAIFWELPEAINEGQYLIPRLTREQRREAITGPIAVCGGQITPRLVNRLLNDMGDNPDQLPILQHALMRTWNKWKGEGRDGPIDLAHYEAIGTMTEALSRHADKAYNELPDERSRWIAERLFKGLTEKVADDMEIRRPLELEKLCALTEGSESEVKAVIETFRREGRSFLMPPAGTLLERDSLVDISHESLIRNWERLKKWVEDEARSARIYRRIAETAALHEKGEAALLRDPELGFALNWREENKPNETWAQRYHSGYQSAIEFLDGSKQLHDLEEAEKEAERKKKARRNRILMAALLVGLIFTVMVAAFIFNLKGRAEAARTKAEAEKELNQRLLYATDIKRAYEMYLGGDIIRAQELLEELVKGDDHPRFTWRYLSHLCKKSLDTLVGHERTVTSVAFSSNGNMLATASQDGSVKVWRVPLAPPVRDKVDASVNTDAQGLFTLRVSAGPVWQVAFSPDDRRLATVSDEKTVKLWDVNERREVALPLDIGAEFVTSVAFSRDGKTLAVCDSDSKVKLWDIENIAAPRYLSELSGTLAIFSPSPRTKTLALVEDQGVGESGYSLVKLFDLSNPKSPRLRDEIKLSGAISTKIAFSPDGQSLAIVHANALNEKWEVILWSIVAKKQEYIFDEQGAFLADPSIGYSPGGGTIAVSLGDSSVRLFEISTGELVRELKHKEPVTSLAFSPGRGALATGSWDKTARVYYETLRGYEVEFQSAYSDHGLTSISLSPDGTTLATASAGEGSIYLYNASLPRLPGEFSGDAVGKLEGHTDGVRGVVFSPDGKIIASASEDRTVKLWDAASRKILASRDDHNKYVKCVAFSADSRLLASGDSSGKVLLWDVADASNPRLLATLRVDTDMVWSVAFSPDGKILATGSWDRTVKLWDTSSHQLLDTLADHSHPVTSVTFSDNGGIIASGSWDRTIKLWDAASHKLIKTLEGHTGAVKTLAFAPDGRMLASGDAAGKVKLWEVATRRELITLEAASEAVASLVLSSDNTMLVTGSVDRTIQMWSSPKGDTTVGSTLALLETQDEASKRAPQSQSQWVKNRRGQPIAENALRGGEDSEGVPLYVCRAKHKGEIFAGNTDTGACSVGAEGKERVFNEYELLAGVTGVWRDAKSEPSDLERFNAGLDENKPVYVCRARYAGGADTGTIINGKCSFGWKGRAEQADEYEILYIRR